MPAGQPPINSGSDVRLARRQVRHPSKDVLPATLPLGWRTGTTAPRCLADHSSTAPLEYRQPQTARKVDQSRLTVGVKFYDNAECAKAEETRIVEQLVEQAKDSLFEPFCDPNRVDGADADLTTLLEVLADSLQGLGEEFTSVVQSLIDEVGYDQLFQHLTILPIARSHAPFWLIPEQRMLMLATRGSESDAQLRNARLQLMGVRLSQDQLDALQSEVKRSGSRRINVVRAADTARFVGDEALHGGNLLYLAYGDDWDFSELRGLLSGIPQEAYPEYRPWVHQRIQQRLSPRGFSAAVREWTNPTHPLAQRTLEDTADIDANWCPDDSLAWIDLTPWITRIREHAQSVIDRDPFRFTMDLASKQILNLLFEDETVTANLLSSGISNLDDRYGSLDSLLQFLVDSGREPVADSGKLQSLANRVNDAVGDLLIQADDGRWDFRSAPHHKDTSQ